MTDHRFRDPEGNEWVATGTPSDDTVAGYPEGTVEIPMVPVEPAAPPTTYQIAKTTPWLRMTDDEAATADAVMSETSARLKQIYMAASYLSSGDPLWMTLHQLLADQFGDERADELLAPES